MTAIAAATADLPFGLTICGVRELDEHCAAGVTHVVSLLDPGYEDPGAFTAFPPHRRLLFRFHDIIEPIPGRISPSAGDVKRLLAIGPELVTTPQKHLLIHCHAGLSRSTASAVLLLAQAWPDRPARAAFEAVSNIRPGAWPNLRMLEIGDALLGRKGEIVAAVASVYRRVLERDPSFHEALILAGRNREIIAAAGERL
jgi:predicted protein tyrosine phosphatase